jgi:PD-(D/E)XK endonuclease
MTTDQKGSVAEAAVAFEAIKLGLGVFRPLSDGESYDLVLDLRPRLVRVQCKWAARRGDVIVVTCRSCRRSADGFARRTYTAEEIDAFAAYSADTGGATSCRSNCSTGGLQFRFASRRPRTTNASASTGLRITSSRLNWAATGP